MTKWPQCAVFALIVICFCVRNFPWHLDNYDQAKQAYTSFEMVDSGHWWYQHTPKQDYATKPPLVGWISTAIYRLTGWWDVAWRLPSLVSALVILFLLKRAGGILAASVFGLNYFTPRLATLVRTDMPLTLFIFLVGFLIYEKASMRCMTISRFIFTSHICSKNFCRGVSC